MAGGVLLLVYAITLAPGVTFWDAGELIAAAHTFGIPHPPGTPLYMALGRAWSMLLGDVIGVARAMNLLSAVCTAAAGALSANIVGRSDAQAQNAAWGALAGALCAGLMTSAWANATEAEVYAVSLLHVVAMLACAQRAADEHDVRSHRWVVCTAYLIALIPAVHLSALVGAPAAVLLASRRREGGWDLCRVLLLLGVTVASAGVGRMSVTLTGAGIAIAGASIALRVRNSPARPSVRHALAPLMLVVLASSALLIMFVRAQFDPAVNQGNPASLISLADVVARRQYDVAAMWPRRAPIWIQLATLAQYADWQAAFAWGRGIFTTPARVMATVAFAMLGIAGWREMRKDMPRVAEALAMLSICGSLGVCAYLNLKAGSSIGYGFVAAEAHEARERDYFFVLGFWGWGLFAGYGALAFVRSRRWPAPLAITAALIPLVGNWTALDRPRALGASAPRTVASALLESAPRSAVLFVAGDNDTYPLWYLQQVEGVRPDVALVTIPLLPADWYVAEIARRTGLRWPVGEHVAGARWQHEERAALIARAARAAGRPVAVSAAVSSSNRALLGSRWALAGAVYLSGGPADMSREPPVIGTIPISAAAPSVSRRRAKLPDDVSAMMLAVIDCQRLGRIPAGRSALRDSLEVTCNLR